MSSSHSGSAFASSLSSEEIHAGPMPIVLLLEEVDTYAGRIFDNSAKTIDELGRMERVKAELGRPVDLKKLNEREVLLTSFLHRIAEAQQNLAHMRTADFPALSLVWGNGAGLVGQGLQDIITRLVDMERQILILRKNFDGEDQMASSPSHSEQADALLARGRSLMEIDNHDRAIQRRRDAHPCVGALRLIKGDDTGDIDRCLTKDLSPAEVERLRRGGDHGTYLFWKCNDCQYRLKYFVSKSRAASLLSNDDVVTFNNSNLRCTRAFLSMSHLTQRERRGVRDSPGPPRYTCLICTLHRPAATPGSKHVFSTRDEYAKHLENVHYKASLPPTFILKKLGIDHDGAWPDRKRRELWIA